MARKVVFTDDLDGSEGAETVSYSFEGNDYEIDLSEANLEKFRSILEPYLESSRLVERAPATPAVPPAVAPARAGRRRSSGTSQTRDDLGEIRAWAKAKGYDVADRGRIKREIIEEYDREHS